MLVEITKKEESLLKNEYSRATKLCGEKNMISWTEYLARLALIKQSNPMAFSQILNKEERNLLN